MKGWRAESLRLQKLEELGQRQYFPKTIQLQVRVVERSHFDEIKLNKLPKEQLRARKVYFQPRLDWQYLHQVLKFQSRRPRSIL